ncbi:MAG: polysaccharide pyruvyl transferase family protein [Acidimicrobiaceae bacterium]|nr:polysaccharide pyruvyl transferase family protein [Acidimicrobiaceae bacterium]
MALRIALAGWYGSDNLGDEMILSCMAAALRARGVEPVAVSIDPERTAAVHGVEAVAHRSPLDGAALRRSLRGAHAMVLSGGVVQSETSPWNMWFHMSRLRAYRRSASALSAGTRPRAEVAAIGLGAGHVRGARSRRMAVSEMRRACHVVTRDAASAQRLRDWGVPDVAVGADPVLAGDAALVSSRAAATPPPHSRPQGPTGSTVSRSDSQDTICVILRPPNRRGIRTAAAKARTSWQPWTGQLARSLDALAEHSGMTLRLLPFQPSQDTPMLAALRQTMRTDAELVTLNVDNVLAEVARSRLVVTMRYHGAIAALLNDQPAVVLDYSPKMRSLAAEGGGWASLVDLAPLDARRFEPHTLLDAANEAQDKSHRTAEARGLLRARLKINDAALDDLLERIQ